MSNCENILTVHWFRTTEATQSIDRVAHEGILSSVPVEGSTQSVFLEGPFPRQPWGGSSRLIYHPVLSLAPDCRQVFFFFLMSGPKWRRAGIVLCCATVLSLQILCRRLSIHTLCIVLLRTLQGLACGVGIQGVCRLHLRTLAANIVLPRCGILLFQEFFPLEL